MRSIHLWIHLIVIMKLKNKKKIFILFNNYFILFIIYAGILTKKKHTVKHSFLFYFNSKQPFFLINLL
jgi:hypothetical protein